MSLIRFSFARVRVVTVAAVIAVVAVLVSPVAASAVVTPGSGDPAGGTAVTINGIHFVQVSAFASGFHTLGLTSEGSVYAWGANGNGQLGNDSPTNANSPTPVQVLGVGGSGFLTGITSVAAGTIHSVAVSGNGSVYAWGYGGFGQLGDGSTANTNRKTPVQVKDVAGTGVLAGITSVAAGDSYSVAVSSNGSVYAWGLNTSGQLGNGTTTNSSIPVQVKDVAGTGVLAGITSVAAGTNHSVAVSSNGSVYAWGNNGLGQLGNGSTTTPSRTPVQVLGVGGSGVLAGITSVAAGTNHSVAVSSDGSVYAWGDNSQGQLGNGTIARSLTPVRVKDVAGSGFLTGITNVAAGTLHTVAVSSDGSVYAWGYNVQGQLGDGSNTRRLAPVLSANFQPVSVTFGGVAATNLVATGYSWSVTTPAGSAGSAAVVATANIFGGLVAATPATATWNAGTFTYAAGIPPATSSPAGTLAATGASTALLPTGIAVFALGLGLLTAAAFRRCKRVS